MTILAVFPVLPLLFVALGGGGLAAWLFGRKGKTAKPVEPSAADPKAVDPTKGPPEPTIDPVSVKRIPFIDMVGVDTTARLEGKGAVWSWQVKGAEPATGGDEDAGRAVLDMAQAFSASSPRGSITGTAGSATNPTVDFGVQPDQDGIWSWTITTADIVPSRLPGVPSKVEMVANGYEPSRVLAVLQLLSALSDAFDWLFIPAFEGGAGMPQPQPDPEPELPGDRPGIVITGSNLGITNLATWIAYAAPLIRAHFEAGSTADEIMDDIIGVDLPAKTKLNSKPIAVVQKAVNAELEKMADGSYVESASPDVKLAAQIVGSDFKPSDWWVGRYKGHVLLTRPAKVAGGGVVGGKALPDPRFEYLIWEGAMRKYDADVIETAVMGKGKTRNATINAAKARIDNDFKDAPPIVDAVIGTLMLPDAPTPECKANEIWSEEKGKCVKLPEISYRPAKREVKIVAPTWMAQDTTEIVVFDFLPVLHRTRMDWTIGIGICMTQGSATPFGSLSTTIDPVGAPTPWGGGGGFQDPFARFQIRESPGPGIGGQGPKLVDFNDFRNPLSYKAQFIAEFKQGADINVTQYGYPGMAPSAKITKKMQEIDGAVADDLDPCSNREQLWPKPKKESRFMVMGVGQQLYKPWLPVPTFSLVAHGPRLFLRVKCSGLPVFADQEGGESPATVSPTNYNLNLRVWATGINAPR